ncbi:unnamed protein product [Enterobius vermicularis]|uniref:ShKT domain-containing protein n=1 Tax=Enterobius vermicularis TaxID=51028 RepID=A0A0N4V590_ENTVE|nr:unnamed protein product [Enterobius vermicularis]
MGCRFRLAIFLIFVYQCITTNVVITLATTPCSEDTAMICPNKLADTICERFFEKPTKLRSIPDSRLNCAKIAEVGGCVTEVPWIGAMLQQECPHSCGLCEVSFCADKSEMCPLLSEICNHKSWFQFMGEMCPRTCRTCNKNFKTALPKKKINSSQFKFSETYYCCSATTCQQIA